ncbi:hypothetical protein GQR58_028171 [Nymphon striatum]|nr:hypothetical protein GQR58_028171 [Nymphon striatum]
MPKLNNNNTQGAKRYQNPEVFEQLAIEYAVGSMQGRARKRFEVLMETHFYLKATVEAYENKFANLVELLPETKAPDTVWAGIEAHIKESEPQEEKTPCAMLESDTKGPMAFTKIEKSDMMLKIDVMKDVQVADDMVLTLWCHPKKGGMPMKMGTISKKGKTEIKISKEEWQNMKNVGLLAISVEHKDKKTSKQPTGKIILKGQLSSAGHLSSLEASELLQKKPEAKLIDIRSSMEFLFIGHPSQSIHIAWMEDPDWDINPNFYKEIHQIQIASTNNNCPIILICRSGNRSEKAGLELIEEGMKNIYHSH